MKPDTLNRDPVHFKPTAFRAAGAEDERDHECQQYAWNQRFEERHEAIPLGWTHNISPHVWPIREDSQVRTRASF